MRLSRFALFVMVGATSGCSDPDGPGPEPPNPTGSSCIEDAAPAASPIVIPGRFVSGGGFEPIVDGQALEKVFGPQGGTHVDFSTRIHAERTAQSELTITVEGREDLAGTSVMPRCAGWAESSTRMYDPPTGELELIYRLNDWQDNELATATIAVSIR